MRHQTEGSECCVVYVQQEGMLSTQSCWNVGCIWEDTVATSYSMCKSIVCLHIDTAFGKSQW
jgi:hypothetical protein